MKYKHLNKHERDKLAVLRSQGWTFREIAVKLARSPSALSRELKRNNSRTGYFPHKAQEKADKRHKESHKKKRLKTYAIRLEVEDKLMKGWSPEVISGRLRKLNGGKCVISHESIYQWIYKEVPYLIGYLHQSRRKRYPRSHKRAKRAIIPNRISIKERPADIGKRKEIGHWESDLITTYNIRSALQVTAERKSRYVKLKKLKEKTSKENREAICSVLKDFPSHMRRSITYDNGRENVEHERVNECLGTKSYFCEPYHSWEKGTVENTNGLIRRFFPKGTDFNKISEERIKEVELWLNQRPRKCLGFKTPAEVFNSFVALTP